MKRNIKNATVALSAAVLAFSFTSYAFAATFSDVPSSNYAYAAIDSITSKGIMSGDATGKFNPDKYIDKFDTSKMFAILLGYKYTGASAEETAYFDKAYTDNSATISKYSSKFAKWNKTTDKEVAFLLAKGFYTSEDLEQFVILNSAGAEQLRALSREEMASFLVRYLGKTKEASAFNAEKKYADDNAISENKKRSVYYINNLGIMLGDSSNNFKPKGAVTRADFCYILNTAMTKMGIGILNAVSGTASTTIAAAAAAPTSTATTAVPQTTAAQTTPAQAASSQPAPAQANTGTLTVTIEKFFPSLNIVQVYENNQHRLYKVISSAEIKINGALGSVSNVPAGSQASITLVNGEITAIAANNAAVQTATEQITQQTTVSAVQAATQTTTQTATQTTTSVNTEHTPSENELTYINGTIDNVDNRTLTVTYKTLSSDGTSNQKGGKYELVAGAEIKKNGSTSDIAQLKSGDFAEMKIFAAKIYSINVVTEENESSKDSDSKETIEGYISSVKIAKKTAVIGISETEDSTVKAYEVDTDNVPVYALKIGDKVKAHVKGGTIIALAVKKAYDDETITGYITSKKSNYIVVEYFDGESLKTKKINYDKDDTYIISGTSGKEASFSDLDEDMKVYVILGDDEKTAENISIIENN